MKVRLEIDEKNGKALTLDRIDDELYEPLRTILLKNQLGKHTSFYCTECFKKQITIIDTDYVWNIAHKSMSRKCHICNNRATWEIQ